MSPIVYDLYCGLGGWAEGFLAEGYRVIGFDVVRMPYPALLVLQDVLTLHGSQLRNAAVIVASPPCTEPSYRAMPWTRAKALNAAGPPVKFIGLFEACFRIQREASEAAGRYIPLVVENVKGAQTWVGPAKWHYGSYYLWGDVPALMPMGSLARRSRPLPEPAEGYRRCAFCGYVFEEALGKYGCPNCEGEGLDEEPEPGTKQHGSGEVWFDTGIAHLPSASPRRKAASALIAKIPFPLAQHIARVYKPQYPSTSPKHRR